MYRFIHIALAGGSSASETPNSDMCISAEQWIFRSPRAVRDALLAEGLAEEHRWIPNSGWTTFQVRGERDLQHALWLMRLSHLRYALKTASDARGMLEHESEELGLSPHLRSLLQQHLPTQPERTTTDRLTA